MSLPLPEADSRAPLGLLHVHEALDGARRHERNRPATPVRARRGSSLRPPRSARQPAHGTTGRRRSPASCSRSTLSWSSGRNRRAVTRSYCSPRSRRRPRSSTCANARTRHAWVTYTISIGALLLLQPLSAGLLAAAHFLAARGFRMRILLAGSTVAILASPFLLGVYRRDSDGGTLDWNGSPTAAIVTRAILELSGALGVGFLLTIGAIATRPSGAALTRELGAPAIWPSRSLLRRLPRSLSTATSSSRPRRSLFWLEPRSIAFKGPGA